MFFIKKFFFKKAQNKQDELSKLIEAFYNFDLEKSGYLSRQDLEYIVTTDGNPLAGKELQDFLNEGDFNRDGIIDYKAFAQILLADEDKM